jgi:plastocyanin
VLALVLAAACGGPGAQPQTVEAAPAPAADSAATVVAKTVRFAPSTLSVPVGAAVTWANEETLPIPHTVTSGTSDAATGAFDLDLPQGGSVTFTFDEAGAYPFFCSIHRQMTGEVAVG